MYPVIYQSAFHELPRLVPERIVSLVPSQTELLHYLGMNGRVAGITRFCTHPAGWQLTKEKIGGTKDLRIEKIKALRPDLVIANKEENVREQVEALAAICPVYVSEVSDLPGALQMIRQVGALVSAGPQAAELVKELLSRFGNLRQQVPAEAVSVAYAIWQKPYMVAGGDSFIQDMLDRCGFRNVFARLPRYPVVSSDMLQEANPQKLLLSSEPFPFRQKHIAAFRALLPETDIRLVDGSLFSWYGSRLLQAPGYFAGLLKNSRA